MSAAGFTWRASDAVTDRCDDLGICRRPAGELRWLKRVGRCREESCPRVTWTETSEAIAPRVAGRAGRRRGVPAGR